MEWVYIVGACLLGAFPLVAAVKDWDFFFNSAKARIFVKILGKKGARIFYGALGAFVIAAGIICLIGGMGK